MLPESAADKFFEIKILTSNPLGLNILRGILAEPAPDRAFGRVGGGGDPPTTRNSHFGTQFRKAQKGLE